MWGGGGGGGGGGDIEGEVFVQAFTPFHPAIQYARRHDYLGFYEQEIEFREALRYPPFARVALVTLRGRNEEKVQFSADHVRKELEALLAGFRDLILAGPGPAPLAKAESYYRFQIMIRTKAMSRLASVLDPWCETLALPDDVRLTLDIDPVDLM